MRPLKTICRVLAFCGPLAAIPIVAAEASDRLTVLYEDRPPYYITNTDGSVGGVVLAPVSAALDAASIEADWVVRSFKRQIEEIKRDANPVCSPGWFKKPEREAFAKFSRPVYRDQPQVVVARSDNARRISHPTLDLLLADSSLRIGVKLGYSYGAYIDGLLAKHHPLTVETSQDIGGMTRMLLGRRFDYLVAAPEEYASLAERLGIAGGDIVSLRMRDVPPGNKRYLMCSRRVDDGILARFNAALSTVAGVPSPDR